MTTTKHPDRGSTMRYFIYVCALCLLLLPRWSAASETSWWNDDWSYRKPITLDTTSKGASMSQATGRIPLLIRLHPGNFQFDGVANTGADLRFISSDGKTPLNYQIENFDPVLGVAQVWLDVTDLPANAQQTVWMYYGNTKAPAMSSGPATFDADYTLVYHFDDQTGAPPKDATAYGNNAMNGALRIVDGGIAGKAARFDGSTVVTLPAGSSLDIKQDGGFTFSAWIKLDALPTTATLIYGHRQDGKALLIGIDGGAPFVEIDGDKPQRSAAGQPLKAGQWTHVAVTATGGQIVLYVNGNAYANLSASLPALSGSATLGGDVASTTPAAVPYASFVGMMDEVRLSRVARSPTLIAADASSQGAESKLIAYGEDEKKSGFGFGYFGIIVKSVTVDAWVVIALLMIMALISWVVMWQRGTYVSAVSNANDRFMHRYRELGGNLLGLSGNEASPAAKKELADSSLYRLYETGAKEVWRRRDAHGHLVIASESIEAIRAVMDSTLVRENQALSRSMVMLTIAISGGPFLGLLGTVVGVMITFAAIAAAGDVNINAIAPGISAALLATVAGLFVAIPALFGYNYLLTRNKAVTANMQVFVDEFVTRLAELHRSADQSTLDAREVRHAGQ
ncbi:MotA/TolQ/ExbB proton channel family protein [Dyella dinghuensis]|uniref:MotA/TolQ/ExbB proton channel family protein n=1 Tax=Dyella dinghuensis TaxID=1920169 RepID=A0A3S0RDC5_9GAMM|nr:MotA/TolQ/ExbB proton channel family protein [Dyella dinghuensis]RUL63087.1 MotA/TolQ/ExbB proton channel family protein [Dyella dinghuensis]